jgi:hypothetical protein
MIIPCVIYSLSFSELADPDIPGVSQASLEWGDFDNDGFLDLLITGHTGTEPISRIYRNDGEGTFTWQSEIEFTGVSFGKGIWGDYNNDGWLDVLISGRDAGNQPVTKLYRNNGDGSFTELAGINLPGTEYCTINWVDFNNNGWLDVFIAGETETETITRIYRNNGNDTFGWWGGFAFPGYRHADSAWRDINGNGYPDLIINGRIGQTKTTSLYLNDSGNSFILQQDTGFPDVDRGSAAWGDYDNDGLPDLLITGLEASTRIARVFRNLGEGAFQFTANLTGIAYGKGIWHDINNNGLLDIIICGAASGVFDNLTTKVYLNTGNNSFQEAAGLGLVGLSYSAISAIDLNDNGKTDLMITGMISSTVRDIKLYLNGTDVVNTLPSPPDLLSSVVSEGEVILSWNNGSDAETSDNGLSYNIWLQPYSDTELQLMAPMADSETGFRRVSKPGNAGFGNSFTLKDLPSGNYVWAVQTIDSVFTGSLFSNWQSFFIPQYFLSPPVNLTITESNSEFFLTWGEVTEASYYLIYASENPSESNWQLIGETAGTELTVPADQPMKFFRITAVME